VKPKQFLFFILLILLSCNPSDTLKIITDVPSSLKEVSGTESVASSPYLWMINDSGNKPRLFAVSTDGKIEKTLKINTKNHDWEDLTTDDEGNIYIGDFGNNANKRQNLAILKVSKDSLNSSGKIDVERIRFSFEDQTKFPPKKKKLYFDCEAFFYHNNHFYLFTKSRVKHDFGKTNMYKIPATRGNHTAELVDSFTTCSDLSCWITSADISANGKQVVLLTSNQVWVFSNFEDDNFFLEQ
jgi:hypothetical protein